MFVAGSRPDDAREELAQAKAAARVDARYVCDLAQETGTEGVMLGPILRGGIEGDAVSQVAFSRSISSRAMAGWRLTTTPASAWRRPARMARLFFTLIEKPSSRAISASCAAKRGDSRPFDEKAGSSA
jgi:hypothetical protein